jgi:CubicO group peptidase (beta-lactamase class C family)
MKDETFGAVIDWGLGPMVNSIQYTGKPAPYGYGDHASPDAFGHGGQQSSVVFADPGYGLSVVFAANGRPGEPNNHRRTQPVLTALYEDLSPTL